MRSLAVCDRGDGAAPLYLSTDPLSPHHYTTTHDHPTNQTLKVGPDAVAIPVTADQAFLGEVFGTLLLVLAVLFCTDTARSMEHPHMTALIPLTIGLVVLIDHLALIPIDGALPRARSYLRRATFDPSIPHSPPEQPFPNHCPTYHTPPNLPNQAAP